MIAMLAPLTAPAATRQPVRWWEGRGFLLFLVLLAAVPLLYPPIPPLIDLPAHMGRYAVQLEVERSPALQQWFGFEWKLIGNLGVDLLVEVLAPILGLDRAVKLIVLLIPMLTVAGFLWTAKEIHGRLPATAPLAVPLAYAYPFHFGFVNYCLAMGIAFTGYALALRLTRQERPRLRGIALLVLGMVAWTAHAYGWAMLGLLWFVTVLVRRWPNGPAKALWSAIWSCLPLTAPLVPMLLWRSGSSLGIDGWFGLGGKLVWIVTLLRDRWLVPDLLSAGAIYGAIATALVWRARFRFDPALLGSGLALLGVAMVLPSTIFGSAFADVRLIPYAVATLILAIALQPQADERFRRMVAMLATGFVIVRIALTTGSLALYSNSYTAELRALNGVLSGSRIAAFSEVPCNSTWYDHRLRHLPNLAVSRKQAFVNGQFVSEGWNALRVTYQEADPYTGFPSSMATDRSGCEWPALTVTEHLDALSRSAFDYVWVLDVPEERRPRAPWLTRTWASDNSALYRVLPVASTETDR